MTNASRDENGVPTLLGALHSDPSQVVPIKATSGRLQVEDASTGSDAGPVDAPRDENGVPSLMAVSSADGVTPVVIYATAGGKLLVDSA